jgi:hypothetical protein
MKNFNTKLMILLAGICLMAVGCGKSNSTQDGSSEVVDSGTDTTPITPPTSPGTGTTTGSNTVTFTPVSMTELSNYVGTHSLNAPTNIQLTVSLADQGGAHYGGSVKISYTDVGIRYTGNFESGTGLNPKYDSLKDNNKYQAQYNTWYTQNGTKVFTGMFQDKWGAVVLVIDNVVNAGDGQGGGYVTGSVYYRNFAYTYATQSPYRKCWFIYEGPFNCRSYSIINKTSTVPDGFIKLGTFSNLNVAASFK